MIACEKQIGGGLLALSWAERGRDAHGADGDAGDGDGMTVVMVTLVMVTLVPASDGAGDGVWRTW